MVATTIEQFISDGFSNVLGDTAIMGIVFIAFFTIFVMLQGTRLDGKLTILVPVLILSAIFIPWMAVLLALGLGVVIYLAAIKMFER